MSDIYELERKLHQEGWNHIVGTDEVGRGPMAGPLVVAAVILPKDCIIEGLDDSKKLSQKKREQLYPVIMEKAIEIQIVFIDEKEVDQINVYQASKKGMMRAIEQFETAIDYVLTDAMPLVLPYPSESIIKGDGKSASIAAASIVAKVTRDRYMIMQDKLFPQYGFKQHKGYVTKRHLMALKKYGPCEIHRLSFEPVKNALLEQLSLF
ncbi:MAG: ribonuclease HII [Bacilli bacterium]|jgi:ribonuclease HII|nr:ribonuclease HII [Bacilli bacterium]MDY0064570.1 ribonuclease HII [Bacilli bacterium]